MPGSSAAAGTKEFAAKLGHGEVEAAWGLFDANVLIIPIVISQTGRACLRQHDAVGYPATVAPQTFHPPVAFGHSAPLPCEAPGPRTLPECPEVR